MNHMSVILDVAVCVLWMLTYVFVLVGTIKYRCPMISPISQLFFGTNEFAVLLFFVKNASTFHPYVIVTYICWALVEIAIFIAIIKNGGIRKEYIISYIVSVAIISIILYLCILYKDWLMFICYFNAFCGVLIWLLYVAKNKCPFTWITLVSFVAKTLADVLAVFVNFKDADFITGILCLTLPLIDSVFIFLYAFRRRKLKKC